MTTRKGTSARRLCTPRVTRPRSKRKACAHCKRVRLAKFIEWHPGIEEWQCSNFDGCDRARDRAGLVPGFP